MLVCPFFNKDKLSGVLQLINKKGSDPISNQDVIECGAIGPALSMVLDLCDNQRGLASILTGLALSMKGMKTVFNKKVNDFTNTQTMNDISFHLDHVRVQSENLAANKYENLIQENEIFNDVFKNL